MSNQKEKKPQPRAFGAKDDWHVRMNMEIVLLFLVFLGNLHEQVVFFLGKPLIKKYTHVIPNYLRITGHRQLYDLEYDP